MHNSLKESFFSIKNDSKSNHKIITIFNIRFRVKSVYLTLANARKQVRLLESQKNVFIENSKRTFHLKKTYKYVHIMYNEKFNKPFVDFLNSNFNPHEHLILCNRRKKETVASPFPTGENVYEYVNNLEDTLKFFDIDLYSDKVEKIICHSLMDDLLTEFLYKNKKLLKKTYWFIWGADLYNAPVNNINDYVRANFKGYISDTDGDCQVAMAKYNSNPKTFNAGYTFPITKEMLDNVQKEEKDYIQIQVNNSCDISILEMLDTLSKFKNEKIKIRTILCYGDKYSKQKIIKKGKKIFGDKFEYLDEMLSPQEYAQYVAQNDILILNHNRQQGLGNSFVALAMGTKLFIKSDVTTYNHFNNKDIKVFDTYSIKNMNFEDFIGYDSMTKENNMKKSLIFFDDNYLKELWSKILNG